MNGKTYTPKPIDTSSIILPPELLDLTERIAENVHDVWAVGRLAEGWSYGEKDAEKKTTKNINNPATNIIPAHLSAIIFCFLMLSEK